MSFVFPEHLAQSGQGWCLQSYALRTKVGKLTFALQRLQSRLRCWPIFSGIGCSGTMLPSSRTAVLSHWSQGMLTGTRHTAAKTTIARQQHLAIHMKHRPLAAIIARHCCERRPRIAGDENTANSDCDQTKWKSSTVGIYTCVENTRCLTRGQGNRAMTDYAATTADRRHQMIALSRGLLEPPWGRTLGRKSVSETQPTLADTRKWPLAQRRVEKLSSDHCRFFFTLTERLTKSLTLTLQPFATHTVLRLSQLLNMSGDISLSVLGSTTSLTPQLRNI